MGKIFSPFISLFKNHKLKMLTVLLVAIAFFILLFPNDDLADYISMQISRGGGPYIQLEDLGLSFLPSPGVSARDVLIEPAGLPPLHMSSLQADVALTKILLARLGFSARTEGLFKSSFISVDYGQGSTTKSGTRADDVDLKAEKISLDDLFDYLRNAGIASFRLQGGLNLDSNLHLDHGFEEQPSGTIKAVLPQLTIPSQTVMLDMNGVRVPQQIPTLEFGNVTVEAKINDGVLDLQSVKIGGPGKEISGTVKGTVGLLLQKNPAGVAPVPSNLDLAVDLTLDKAFIDRNKNSMLGGFFSLIEERFKHDTGKGTRIAMHVKLAKFNDGTMPTFSELAK